MMPSFELEDAHEGVVIGVDEVGRGPWAGPVVACAFCFKDRSVFDPHLKFIQDSKKVTQRRREILFGVFEEHRGQACVYACAQASVEEIDRLNIREATFLAMQRAVEALDVNPSMVLIDGNACPKLEYSMLPIIKGDSVSFSIAAASIIAKVTRDRLMADLAAKHPHYAWESNAGYGTKDHQEGLKQAGITEHHRKSFAPIQKLLDVTPAKAGV